VDRGLVETKALSVNAQPKCEFRFVKLLVLDVQRRAFSCGPRLVGRRQVRSLNYLTQPSSRLTIAGQFAAHRNVGCENLIKAGVHRLRPGFARFAIVVDPVAASFP
jgi:hypothetical protein